MTSSSEQDSNGKVGSGVRPITREDEGRVRAVVQRALGLDRVLLEWDSDGLWRIEGSDCVDAQKRVGTSVALARAGIVPGPEGWRWAPAPPPHDFDPLCEACKGETTHGGPLAKAPPAWLTAAVLAALPADGTPRALAAVVCDVLADRECAERFRYGGEPDGATRTTLAHLVSTGEIEAGPEAGTWRRWGVPEGFHWVGTEDVRSNLVGTIEGTTLVVATAFPNGGWRAGTSSRHNTATPPTLAAARTAALRACWERGVFGTRPAPAPAPTLPQDAPAGEQRAAAPAPVDRPSQLRAALLSVLSRGPVEGLARLLPALDAAMGEAPGVARATGAEARQAAREVGAVVDGARWALPAMVTGWGWRLSRVPRCWFLTRLDAEDVEGGAVATVESEHGAWGWQLAGAPAWSEADSLADGQTAALAAARRAGLFAPRSVAAADDVTDDGASAVTAKGGEAVALDPLAALALALCGGHAYESESEGRLTAETNAAGLAPLLAAWGATLVEQSRASVEALPEIRAMRSPRVTVEGPTLRAYADDGKTVVHEKRVAAGDETLRPAWAVLEARAATAERAAAEARLEAEAAERRAVTAEAALSDLRAALADLAARWAGGAA